MKVSKMLLIKHNVCIDMFKVHIEDRACLLATEMKKENLEIYNLT